MVNEVGVLVGVLAVFVLTVLNLIFLICVCFVIFTKK